MSALMINLAERALIPDPFIRFGIRRLLRQRLEQEGAATAQEGQRRKQLLIEQCSQGPIAVAQQLANEQHYEVPAEFYRLVLGPHLKYSCALWGPGVRTLVEAEEAMLALTCERAELDNGQRVLELGCGWGSLSLWMARHYPQSLITSVSNSSSQKAFIDARAQHLGIRNLKVVTADVAAFEPGATFDRVVSVEMFEHMRNHARLMGRIHEWLVPGGKLFVHIFCHRELFYTFDASGPNDWMGNTFFSGGVMPSFDLLESCQNSLAPEGRWQVNGQHYARTLEAWLDNADARKDKVLVALSAAYGASEARLWLQRWRMFFMACAELFGYGDGEEWLVGHYRFVRSMA